jgi:hypothetical protein
VIPQPPIVTTDQWGARRAKAPPVYVGAPVRTIFHHTAGHHPEIGGAGESRAESFAYARAIQRLHMDVNGWNDSGHNFLVCRNGLILVGRHMSLPAVRSGRMVVSAHCPGENDQPGVEHEHLGDEAMTPAQRRASIWLHAWMIERCHMRRRGDAIRPHREFFATACPGSPQLMSELPALRQRVNQLLAGALKTSDL